MRAWLWQFLAGYVTIKIEGLKLLAFINDAAAQGIRLDRAERESYSRILARVTWRDYQRLLLLARGRPLRIVALAQRGLPCIALQAVKRLAFAIGLVLCIAALAVVNRFVLDVRVTGCTIPGLEARVTGIAGRNGLMPGAGKAALDLHRVEKALMLELEEISFAAVRVNGVVATVSVVEGVPQPEMIDRNKPCHVVAGRDGVVRKVIVHEGQASVAAGDTVRRGQVLVNGAVTTLEGIALVHARADVFASIWYEGRGTAPLFCETTIRTGATAQRVSLEFAGFSLPIEDLESPPFASFDTEQKAVYLLGPGLKGPRIATAKFFECYPVIQEMNFAAALGTIQRQALQEVLELLPDGAEVLGSRTDYNFADGNIVARVFIEVLENIAVETPIG